MAMQQEQGQLRGVSMAGKDLFFSGRTQIDRLGKTNRGFVLFAAFISTSIILFSMMIANDISISRQLWYSVFSIITIFFLIFSLCVFKCLGYGFLSFPSLFMLCNALFYFGQLWLLGLFPEYTFQVYSKFNSFDIYPFEVVKFSTSYVLITLLFVVWGIVLYRCKKNCYQPTTGTSFNKKLLRKAGLVIILITLPFNVYSGVLSIITSFSSGYHATFNMDTSDFISCVGWISVLGFSLILLSTDAKVRNAVLLFAVALFSVEMLSGNRKSSICAILTLFIVYFSIEKKNRRRKVLSIVLIAVIGLLLLTLITAIKSYRNVTKKDFASFLVVLAQNFSFNSLFSFVEEFGSTAAVPSITKIYLDETGGYLYGWSYISGLFSFFPNIFGNFIANITRSGAFVRVIQTHGIYGAYDSIGGSYIGELLINFSVLGPFGGIVIGRGVGFLSNSLEEQNKHLPYAIMPIFSMFEWIRWDFNNIVRYILWSWVLFIVVKTCLRRRNEVALLR